ncbi:MAG: zinc-dependent alcohol dehydrogenase family protein [Acidobacteria bacterium]|nr:zinc-dependent alcohol dehydrogenase family protein [Acidobacteriota bacterium]
MNRALRFHATGDPLDELRLEEVAPPEPGPGEVRLKMRARPINPSDLLQVRGVYGRSPALPATAGLEGLGTVDALGEGVGGWAIGQRVVPMGAQGTWADALISPASNLIAVPDTLPDDQACQAVVNPLTAWLMVEELGLGPGQWLIQSAAASAVGRCLIHLAKLRGFKVLALVRREEDIPGLLAAGAHAALCTAHADWPQLAAKLLPEGAHAALDAVGGALGGEMVKLLRPGGTMLVYGALSMEPLQLPGGQLIFRTATVRGFWLTDWKKRASREERAGAMSGLLAAMAAGQIVVPVAATYPLARWQEAILHAQREGRSGKILLGG